MTRILLFFTLVRLSRPYSIEAARTSITWKARQLKYCFKSTLNETRGWRCAASYHMYHTHHVCRETAAVGVYELEQCLKNSRSNVRQY